MYSESIPTCLRLVLETGRPEDKLKKIASLSSSAMLRQLDGPLHFQSSITRG